MSVGWEIATDAPVTRSLPELLQRFQDQKQLQQYPSQALAWSSKLAEAATRFRDPKWDRERLVFNHLFYFMKSMTYFADPNPPRPASPTHPLSTPPQPTWPTLLPSTTPPPWRPMPSGGGCCSSFVARGTSASWRPRLCRRRPGRRGERRRSSTREDRRYT